MVKYKLSKKSNKLKSMIGGGLIVHICGPQGSGKSTLGKKLLEIYEDKIHIKDLDNLRDDFSTSKKADYQKYIDDYIEVHNDKPLIFTGLDADLCLGSVEPSDDDKTYDLHTSHKFYISLPDEKILRQRFLRQITKLNDRKEWFFDTWLEKPEFINKKLFRFIDLNGWKKQMDNCNELYKERGYEFKHPDVIFEKVKLLLDHKE